MDGRATHHPILFALVAGTASAIHYVAPGTYKVHNPDHIVRPLAQDLQAQAQHSIEQSAESWARLHTTGKEDDTDDSPLLCRWGKWLPELYLLGGPKCATSDLSLELVLNGIPSSVNITGYTFHDPDLIKQDVPYIGKKEAQFFHAWYYLSNGTWKTGEAVQEWWEYMPWCPIDQLNGSGLEIQRTLFADYTPLNLGLVPPSASLTSHAVTAWGYNLTDINLPRTLQGFYGPFSPRLTFIVMLREPLAQLQSAWYHAQYNFLNVEVNATQLMGDLPLETSFVAELERALDLADRGTIQLWLWYSFFGQQVQAFLAQFTAPQFVFIPMYYFLHIARKEVCATLSRRLEYPISCREAGPSVNTHEHPALEEDLPKSSTLRTRFQAFMAPEFDRLVRVLYLAHSQGAALPAFHPRGRDVRTTEVEDWLVAGW